MDKSANRKEEILEAAVQVFADKGYFKATTADVASYANISQPYVYKFYKSKEELLLAALDRSMERIADSFTDITSNAESVENEMTSAYEGLMATHKAEILLQIQALAIREPAVQQIMEQGLSQVKDAVVRKFKEAGIAEYNRRAADFMARGMMCNVALALNAEGLTPRSMAKGKGV